jgi:drug/metabolite transporter (DMT)-like permease
VSEPREDAAASSAAEPSDKLVLAVAVLAVVLWGGSPVATKLAVNEIDPLVVGVLRTILAALVAAPMALLLRCALPKTRSQMVLLAVSAIGGFVVFPVIYSIGLGLTSAVHAALILAGLPLLTGLFAAVLERRAPPRKWWIGGAIAMAGEALLVASRTGFEADGGSMLGDLVVAVACIGVAMGYVAGGRLSGSLGTWPTTLWGITIGGLVALPVLPFVAGDVDWAAVGPWAFGGIAYAAFITSILGYVAWYWALSKGGIGRVATIQFGLPVVSLVLAVLILDEAITPPIMIAAATILAGIWIVQRR